MYIIRRLDQGGGWVTKPGSRGSYTHALQLARRFGTMEAADRELCFENEIIETVDEAMAR